MSLLAAKDPVPAQTRKENVHLNLSQGVSSRFRALAFM